MATIQAARSQIQAPPAADALQLRVLTCGSVDDGKSTLLGRLLFDAGAILDDQVAALDAESRRWGTQGQSRDYALLLDGLSAEREQGITIDVAYRYFSTARRSFILIDSPGHEQYTRNMATGASQADLAVILVDASKGLLPQTRRHAFIAATLGVRHAVLAVNKMDLVAFDETRFRALAAAFMALAEPLGFVSICPIPISAKTGDNLVQASTAMDWYRGPTLLAHLETVDPAPSADAAHFRLPIQLVLRPDSRFRGYAGTLAAGAIRPGDAVVALPSGRSAAIARIVAAGGDLAGATAGQSVTITLDREIDLARGDVLAAADRPAEVASRLVVSLLWMGEESLMTGREYALQLGTATATARIGAIRHGLDIETYAEREATWLGLNEIGSVELILDRPLAAARYRDVRALGGLILVDRISRATVALGVVERLGRDEAAARRWDWRAAAAPAVCGLTMAALAGAISQNVAIGFSLGFANMCLLPIVDRLFGRASWS